nr:hypothetical protein CFP56_78167 [Quercus suber]
MVVGQGCEADVENLVNNYGSHVTNETVKLIDMDKVVFVAMFCGRPLTPGSCGGKKLFICEAFSGNELVD